MNDVIIENHYKPSPKAQAFHRSSARVIVLVGGLGSGKSFSVVKEIEQSALQWQEMPIAVYRKTMPALRDSTLHEFKAHSNPQLGIYKSREEKWCYINNSFVNFRGLDDPTKAKSTNFGLIVMEEAEEFTFEDFRRLNERVRAMGPWPPRIILVLNPVDEDHWIYKQFVDNAKDWDERGGLLVLHFSTYDNLDHLPPGYIEQVTVGMTPDEIDRYIHGKWGTITRGEPVYAKILNSAIHIRRIEAYPGQLLLRGWDFGFNHPAVSFRLVDEMGRMNIRLAILGEKIDLGEFIPGVVAKTAKEFGHNIRILDFGDPRGHDKSANGKETCFQVLESFGINAKGERGAREYVEDGVRQVKKEFSTLIEGIPQLTIDPSVSLIRAAYFGRYVRDEDGRPKKDGYYEHICDADRYISHHHRFDSAVQNAIRDRKMKVTQGYNPTVTGYARAKSLGRRS
jgi:PBSX family phage terminase large subunit